MRRNWKVRLRGHRVVLVPYREAHVRKYHEWMKNPELLELTGSEPLTLEQEFHMQQTWRESEDKCTFIILDRVAYEDGGEDEVRSMVGDTNLFLRGEGSLLVAEVEVMVAEPEARRRRIGWESTCLMLRYGAEELGVEAFEAKVKEDNVPSHAMFDKLGFVVAERSPVFKEVTYRMKVTEQVKKFLYRQTEGMIKSEYKHEPE